jgi:hemerythrin-like domain-containing protein
MKIIDQTTGKRLVDETKQTNTLLNKIDPIKRNVEKGLEDEEDSPMDPPNAYDKTVIVPGVDVNNLSTLLNQFIEEHKQLTEVVSEFEKALLDMMQEKFFITKEINDSFNRFFVYFDEHIVPHNKREERYLFPQLHRKLIESGEHTPNDKLTTAVDLMEDDHVKFIQLASLTFNMLGLAMRLPDMQSRAMTFDLAYHNGKELVELIKLHVFREDNTLFPLAQKLFTEEELEIIMQEAEAVHA